MKADRRHQLATNELAKQLESLPQKLQRWGNTALTVLLVFAAVAMIIRWRMVRAENTRQAMLDQLAQAQRDVATLQISPQELSYILMHGSLRDVSIAREDRASAAADALATVLNTTDDPKVKAQALLTRGDLYWQLANLPPLPGATTQPSLQLPQTSDQYLAQSAGAYQDILDDPAFLKDRDVAIHAHFGLAAVAENRRDWDTAQKHLNLIANDSDVPAGLQSQAQLQLSQLPLIESHIYLAPENPESLSATTQTVQPMISPTSRPSTQPAH
jgi:hypothetical protein